MAKRAKTTRGKATDAKAAQAEAAQAQAKKQATLVLISPQALKSLLREDDKYKGDIDSLTGELREAIGNAKEKKHLDTKAYALLKRFHREKSNEKLANLWGTLLAYMEMSGVMDRINSVSELPLDGEKADEEQGDGEGVEASGEGGNDEPKNVARPQFGGTTARH